MRRFLLLFPFLTLLSPVAAEEVRVSDPESARRAVREAAPGDAVVLAAGVWEDADLRLEGEGEEGRPITIRAETPGGTVFSGASRLRLGGRHLVVSGIWFRDLSGAGADWLEFRIDSKRRARDCRVTECAFTQSPEVDAAEKELRWIGLYGASNQVDRCHIAGKRNKGATLVVWLGRDDPGGHRILANRFDGRPVLGGNGGETIRIGDSATSAVEAGCLVEGNLFHRCDGETECISNKSCGNLYRGNHFVETQGTLTLRHGKRCLVEGNLFLGRGRSRTGGIRLADEGHRVVGNWLVGLRGDGFRAALCLVNGIPGSPANGYQRVVGAEIAGNLVRDCKESVRVGYNDEEDATLAPVGVRLVGNRLFAVAGGAAVRASAEAGITWEENRFRGLLEGLGPHDGLRPAAASDLDAVVPPELPDKGGFGPAWWRREP